MSSCIIYFSVSVYAHTISYISNDSLLWVVSMIIYSRIKSLTVTHSAYSVVTQIINDKYTNMLSTRVRPNHTFNNRITSMYIYILKWANTYMLISVLEMIRCWWWAIVLTLVYKAYHNDLQYFTHRAECIITIIWKFGIFW